ncbi:MAG TPA: choice-of-anchor V domain-containing protein [Longimicrobiales bacterium]|nr:choice-of-anchor V domain-containing protein [Longimicrobiales bacterium]
MRRGLAAALVAGAALSASPPAAGAYRTGPPAGHTGGFGEPTCTACHWGEKGAAEAIHALTVEVPASYRPGEVHQITVVLQDPGLRAAGFQLSARFRGGENAGRQAGSLAASDSTVAVVTGGSGVAYASHSAAGTTPRREGKAAWVVRWTAPREGGVVVFHAAANAANDDASEFGDRIHVTEARTSSR